MSVFYKLQENKIKSSKSKGKWFARATPIGTKTIEDLATMMQQNCTVKRSDIIAVLSEFAETLAWFLQNGYRVKIDRLGAFKVGLRSKGAITPTEFKESENIKSTHINFTPDRDYDSSTKRYTARAMRGVSYANITQKGSDAEMTKRKENMAGGSTTQP